MTHEEISPELHRSLDQLAGQLVWKIGRDEETDEMIVRVGFASSAPRFARKSKLRAATDSDVAQALKTGEYRVEWIE